MCSFGLQQSSEQTTLPVKFFQKLLSKSMERCITETFLATCLTLLIQREKLLIQTSGLLGHITLHGVKYN